ncbi:hypothetical protein ABEB36_001654 [Hypothenemus hampei]|uniref:Uncharacterized protein n=1 Tax=Hypothenemus hampei TaxID=57062 RepID=A0ABD1FFC4_HYPHA
MKIRVILQVLVVLYHYKVVRAIYGFRSYKQPYYGVPQYYYTQADDEGYFDRPKVPLPDLRLKSKPVGPYFGSFLAGYAPSYGLVPAPPVVLRDKTPKVLRPIVVVPNWVPENGFHSPEVEKPVTEALPDDLKYDFRTKTHTF